MDLARCFIEHFAARQHCFGSTLQLEAEIAVKNVSKNEARMKVLGRIHARRVNQLKRSHLPAREIHRWKVPLVDRPHAECVRRFGKTKYGQT